MHRREAAPATKLTERVLGIIVTRASVDPVTDIDKVPFILASTALWHRIGPGYLAFDGAFVKLRAGATVGNVTREAQALARRFPKTEGQVYVADESTQVAAVEQSIHPEAVALAIFAVVLACSALLIVGQAATRLLLQAGSDNPVLAALGMTRGQLTAAGLIEVGVAGAAGAILAGGVAIAASPLMPIGNARRRAGSGGQRRLAGPDHRRRGHRRVADRAGCLAGLAGRLSAGHRPARRGGQSGAPVLAGRMAGRGGRTGDHVGRCPVRG